MSEYIRHELDLDNIDIYNLSDLHVGSKAFHEKAFIKVRDKISKQPNAYVTFGGDMAEAKRVDSAHFNPDGLVRNKMTAGAQFKYFVELWEPIAEKTLLLNVGNHDMYYLPDIDIMEDVCEKLGIKKCMGGFQSWLDFNDKELILFFWHGIHSMPKGAKDPIQREANRRAWLKRELEDLAVAHAMYMGHTHMCMIQPPLEENALLSSGDNVKMRTFIPEQHSINDELWIPKESRWYVNTGTFRRAGMFGHIDYSEIAGFKPIPVAYTKTEIREGKIKRIIPVVV